MQQEATSIVWRRWAIWSAFALLACLAMVLLADFSGFILLGWAAGTVLTAVHLLFFRRY